MSQGPPTGESSEPEAKVLHTKRLYRAVVEAVHRLDLILCNKTAYQEVFKPENISLRNKLRELCVKLMFLHPVDYGRKAEELLWRKHIHSRSTLECAYRTHLVAGIGFYQHLLLYIQSHYQLELQCCIDWTHVTDPLIGCKKPVSASGKEMDWAQMACHRCLVYLGDLSRYQNELAGVDTELLAERFYYQALSVAPQIGMPFNQLGTLAGSKYYNVEAMYCYLRWLENTRGRDAGSEEQMGLLSRQLDVWIWNSDGQAWAESADLEDVGKWMGVEGEEVLGAWNIVTCIGLAQEEARRNRLMRDMAQLRLQLEVSQLEGSLQQPKAQSAMSPYLVPDTQALCHHLPVIRQLATSGRFIVIIPRTVTLVKSYHLYEPVTSSVKWT
ncbi:hypothetical protein H8959_017714 [Pygathrix nigripes]